MKKILTSILLFLFLLTFTINIIGFNYFIHKYEFKKLNVYSEFQDKSIVDKQSLNILKNIYLNTNPDSTFLSKEEVIHINFSSSFTVFHEIFYTNDYWLISSDSDIIKIYPEQFFIDLGIYILITDLIISSLIITFSRIKLNH